MSSFTTYLIGFLILIAGLGYAAYLLNVPSAWLIAGVVVFAGIGVISATRRTKMRDPAEPSGGGRVADRTPPTGPNS